MQSVLAFTDCLSKTLKQNYQLLTNFKSYVKKDSISCLMNTYLGNILISSLGHLAGNQSTWTREEVSTKVAEFITSVFVWI